MITWRPYTDRTTYGYAADPRAVAVAVVRHDEAGPYLWALIAGNVEGVESTRDEAERKAEAAYRHARGLLGGVRT
mgnify:FL=1